MNMDIELLSKRLREYADSRTEADRKKRFLAISQAISLDGFVELLPPPQHQVLQDINDRYNQGQDLSWIYAHQPSLLEQLGNLYFNSLTYLNDKRRNISHFEDRASAVEKRITDAQGNLDKIDETAKLISGASILSEYAKEFDEDAQTHKENASTWLRWLIISILGFVTLVFLLLFNDLAEFSFVKNLFSEDFRRSGYLHILIFTIKAALVFAYLQIPLFIKRNYYAEKHLEQSSIHRRNVLRALHAVHNSITDQVERDKIITTGATIAFSEPETGYITRKEGAGDGDMAESLLARFWK